MSTVRWGAIAAGQDAVAAGELRDLIRDTLGADALKGGKLSGSPPIYQGGAVNLRWCESLTPRLEAIRAQPGGRRGVGARRSRRWACRSSTGRSTTRRPRRSTESNEVVALLGKAIAGSKLLPSFLGADGPRYFLLAIQNNVDQRATGGSVLGYAIVRFQNGQMKLLEGGGIKPLDLSRTGPRFPLPAPVDVVHQLLRRAVPHQERRELLPDFPLVGASWAKFVENARHIHVDGAIALDPYVDRGRRSRARGR